MCYFLLSVGRPRKNFMPTASVKEGSITIEHKSLPPSAEIERKFQEAVKMAELEAQKGSTDQTCANSSKLTQKDTQGDEQQHSNQPEGKIRFLCPCIERLGAYCFYHCPSVHLSVHLSAQT